MLAFCKQSTKTVPRVGVCPFAWHIDRCAGFMRLRVSYDNASTAFDEKLENWCDAMNHGSN